MPPSRANANIMRELDVIEKVLKIEYGQVWHAEQCFCGALPAEVHRSNNDNHEYDCSAFPNSV